MALRLHAIDLSNDVVRAALDTTILFRIPVAIDRVTTVSFPAPIAGLEAAFISQEVSVLSRFHLSHQNGSRYFSLRALTTGVRANLNVILGREIYALEFIQSTNPVYLVEFSAGAPMNSLAPGKAPARLPATLETVKNFERLKSENPLAASAIKTVRPDQIWQLGSYKVRLRQVFRFEEEDTLIFQIGFENASTVPLCYSPNIAGVRVGDAVYYASQFDGTGCLPAQKTVTFYLAITGKPGGGRNNLAVTNYFVPFLGRCSTSSAGTPPLETQPQTHKISWWKKDAAKNDRQPEMSPSSLDSTSTQTLR